ncbi:MAG: hypothetical protein ACYC8U_08510, partial [Thermoleophilia bacterium]
MKRVPVLTVLFVAVVLLLFSAGAASSLGTFEIAQLTINSVEDFPPQVSGDRVVWSGYGGADGGADREIFTWTRTGGIVQLTTNNVTDENPQVSGDRVVWQGVGGSDVGGDDEIF